MAVRVLHLHGQLGKGLAKFGNEHDRVETKTVAAARLGGDLAHHAAYGNQRLGVLRAAHGHQGADHGGATVRHALHLFQQRTHVVGVAFFVTKLGAVVGRVHARQAAERVHAHTRIVGQRGQAGVLRGKARLGQRVLDKGAKRLFGLAHAQVALAHQFHAQRGKHGLQLGELALVVGCQYEFHSQIRLQRLLIKRQQLSNQ